MSLAALIRTSAVTTVSDDNGPWRQFVLDHLDWLSARSITFTISPEKMNLFRYDLKRYLKDELNRHEDITWVVLLLNDLGNDFAFDVPGTYLVPADSEVISLYHSHRTNTANAG